jgi:hypothetical protein
MLQQERGGGMPEICLKLWNYEEILCVRHATFLRFERCLSRAGAMLSNQEIAPMKKLVIALALVSLAASPALAKKYRKQVTTDPANQAAQAYAGSQAYAYAPGYNNSAGSGYPNPIYAFGQYQGADPDSFIRSQLLRDPPNLQ